MIRELFVGDFSSWCCVWQSMLFAGIGLAISFIRSLRPARAHQVLFLAMIAAVIVPAMSALINRWDLGVFVDKPVVMQPLAAPDSDHGALVEDTEYKLHVVEENSSSAIVGSKGSKFPWRLMFFYGWVVASLILAARLIVTFVLGVRLLGRALPLNCKEIAEAVHIATAKLGLAKDLRVYSSQRVRSPVIWCWSKRPILLVPTAVEKSGTKIDWVSVLCHELAHYKRRDHISGLLAELAVCALPWNPLLWWAKGRLVRLSEQACDDWVVALGQSGTDYAESLLDLAPGGQMAFVPAVVTSKKGLAGRIHRILKDKCGNPTIGLHWAIVAVITAGLMAIGVAFAQTRPAKTEGHRPEGLGTRQVRVVHFPADRSLGTLYIRDIGSENWYEDWERLAEAKGPVTIARNKEVKLEVSTEAAADISPLAKLRTDDLQMLCFGWKAVKIASLAPIGNLKGLKALNLQSTKFECEDFKYLTEVRKLAVLRLGDYQLTDASMQYVGKLTSLRSLALWGTGISDEGLKHLEGLTNLTFLALNGCNITDEGVNYLKNMTALEGLQIYQTKITDKGLINLQGFSQLKHIKLGNNGITDKGLKYLENLTSLENIWIDSNPITDEGLSYLAQMKKLKELYASNTKITDAGLVNLRGLKDFRHLVIEGIGDEGIAHLSKLPALELLQILDAQVTQASIPDFKKMISIKEVLLSGDKVYDELLDALRNALPNCKIWDPQRSREYPMPAWRQKFEEVYRLKQEQVLKRIAPPFIPERRDYYLNEESQQASFIDRSPDRFVFHWDGKLKRWGLMFGSPDLNSALSHVFRLKSYEFEGPEELLSMELPGDWIIRDEVSQVVKLKALEQLLAGELGRNIRYEKRTVDREVIVATGRFQFQPLPEALNDSLIYMFSDIFDDRGGGGGTAESVSELLSAIGNQVGMPVIDKTQPSEEMRIPYHHHGSSYLRRIIDKTEKAQKLQMLLANLTKQTDLQFEVGLQPIEVWFVTEQNNNN